MVVGASKSTASNPTHRDAAMQRALPVLTPTRTCAPWGMLAAIDLHGCQRGRLEDPDSIRAFVRSVIEAIGMRARRRFDAEIAAAVAVAHFGGRRTLRVLQR
jgi:hypothetical protein